MKTIIYLSIIASTILAFSSCSKADKKSENNAVTTQPTTTSDEKTQEVELTEAQMKAVNIEVGKIEQRELNNIIRVNGEMALDPQKIAEVTSLIGGVIKEILVIEGTKVTKGQVVAYLENTQIVELQKNYLTTRKEALVAEQEYNRQKELSELGAGVQKTLQQASATFEITKAQLMGLEKQLQQLSISPAQVSSGNMVTQIPIKSPIIGTVSKIKVSTGSYVDTQTSLMQIADNSSIHCDLKVFEKDIDKVSIGQEVDIALTNQPSVRLKSVIYEINKSFEDEAKVIIVHTRIKEPVSVKLIANMYVTGLINVGTQKTDAIPNDAIVSSEGKKYIYVLEKEAIENDIRTFHFGKVEVSVGTSELGYTQITPMTKLEENATVVRSNAFYLASMSTDHGEH